VGKINRLIHHSIGLSTEVGELNDLIKKFLFYGKKVEITHVVEECGDILWYLSGMLDAVGSTLEEAMEKNIAKLQVRYPNNFETKRALNRDLKAESKALQSKSGTKCISVGCSKPVELSTDQYCKHCLEWLGSY